MVSLRLLILPILLVLSAAFSSAETALFCLHQRERRRLRESGGVFARVILALLARPRSVLITILLGNLLVNIFYFSVVSTIAGEASSGGVGTLLWSLAALFGILIFGEIGPKTLALRRPLMLARIVAVPLQLLLLLSWPLRSVFEIILAAFHKILRESRVDQEVIGADLVEIVRRSVRYGVLNELEAEQLSGVLTLRSVHVREVMLPRVDLFAAHLDDPQLELRKRVLEERPEWILACDGDLDHIVGYCKGDTYLLHPERALGEGMGRPCFIPETASLLDLVQECRRHGVAFAVVIDEFGGTAGLLTIERVLEEVVGELRDEHEPRWQPLRPLGGGRFLVEGNLKIREWNLRTGADLPTVRFETLAGFLADRLGRLPRAGDELLHEGQVFRVLKVVDGRVLGIEVELSGEERTDG